MFTIQIYGDFSGYSDIAIGTARLFGFNLMTNFRFPYFSRDIAEFWRRWLISLSTWFRDYLYIPLGGSREGKSKAI
jgi:D-alanyl-lipoteichoic acid acyltransferase DltB (MBOAT superfamily)